MSGALRRIAPALRQLGYRVEFLKAGHARERIIAIDTALSYARPSADDANDRPHRPHRPQTAETRGLGADSRARPRPSGTLRNRPQPSAWRRGAEPNADGADGQKHTQTNEDRENDRGYGDGRWPGLQATRLCTEALLPAANASPQGRSACDTVTATTPINPPTGSTSPVAVATARACPRE